MRNEAIPQVQVTKISKLSSNTSTKDEQLSKIASYFAMTLVGTDFFALLVIARNEAIALTRAIHLGFEAI